MNIELIKMKYSVVLLIVVETFTLVRSQPVQEPKQPMITHYLLQNIEHHTSIHNNKDGHEPVEHATEDSNAHSQSQQLNSPTELSEDDYIDNEGDNEEEIMKRSPQIVFRPLFRHKQMMEERRQRKEEKQRLLEKEEFSKRNIQSGETYVPSASNTHYNYYHYNRPIFICYGQHCRPITAHDIKQLQLLEPTTQWRQVRQNSPSGFSNYNVYTFRKTNP